MAAPGAGPAALAGELLGRMRAELPAVGELGEREQVLAAAWLTGLRSPRTRRAYAGDLAGWLAWLAQRDVDVLAAGRVHADLWVATQLEDGVEASSVRRRLSALSSFYRYWAALDRVGRNPVEGVARPAVDPDYTAAGEAAASAPAPPHCGNRHAGNYSANPASMGGQICNAGRAGLPAGTGWEQTGGGAGPEVGWCRSRPYRARKDDP